MFSMCSELTPRARISDTRIPQLMQQHGCLDPSTLRQIFLEIARQNWPFEIGLSFLDFKQLLVDSGNIVQCSKLFWDGDGQVPGIANCVSVSPSSIPKHVCRTRLEVTFNKWPFYNVFFWAILNSFGNLCLWDHPSSFSVVSWHRQLLNYSIY